MPALYLYEVCIKDEKTHENQKNMVINAPPLIKCNYICCCIY